MKKIFTQLRLWLRNNDFLRSGCQFKSPEELNEHGKSLFLIGDFENALKCFSAALKIKPDYAAAYSNCGTVLKGLKRFPEAIVSFDAALTINPGEVNALHNKGLTLLELQRAADALACFDAVLAINPHFAEAHNGRGVVLRELRRGDEGIASFDAALAIRPEWAEAYCNRGLLLQELKRFPEALDSYGAALTIAPNNCDPYIKRGALLLDLMRLEEALADFDAALAIDPYSLEVHALRGQTLLHLNRPEEALASFNAALAIEPDCVNALFSRGVILQMAKQWEDALDSLNHALLFAPEHAEAHFYCGVIFLALRRFEDALVSFDAALTIMPDWAEAHHNRGVACSGLFRNSEALACFDRALSLKPDFVEAHNYRGVVLNDLGRQEESLASYDKALAIDPRHAVAYNNRGVVASDIKGPEFALESFNAALDICPGYIDAKYNKSIVLIQMGFYREGWALYEWRWMRDGVKSQFGFREPSWLGEDVISGKTLLIYPEQGFGDYIQFCRYALLLVDMGANVVLEVPKPLLQVISSLGAELSIVEKGRGLPPFDYQCPVMSLPLALGTEIETIPAKNPYLYADPVRLEKWGKRLGKTGKIRVGLVWSGSPTHKKDAARSISLGLFSKILELPLEFHCLQKEIRGEDAVVLSKFAHLQRHAEELIDFSETAALIAMMDLVVSVDTSVAHLACAMGKETWILLPYAPDYRWMLERDDSPWYPTATLIRQAKTGDWNSLLSKVERKLASKYSI